MNRRISDNLRKWVSLLAAILFGMPEISVQGIYGAIGLGNLYLFVKTVYPQYKQAFSP